jgi:hypothetical protein
MTILISVTKNGRERHYIKHLYRGNGHELALGAVGVVRELGGVLEHPAHSRLWPAAELPAPGKPTDAFGGFTVEVEQVRWGHPARKRTWLYFVRPTRALPVPPPREPTHWASGSRKAHETTRGHVPPGIKVCSAPQRRRTPPAFADWLLEIAASCTRRT